MPKDKNWIDPDSLSQGFSNPFASLAKAKPRPESAREAPAASASELPQPASGELRLRSLSLERAKRAGKEVTRLAFEHAEPESLKAWLKKAQRELGLGGHIEDNCIFLQGDQRERFRGLLAANAKAPRKK